MSTPSPRRTRRRAIAGVAILAVLAGVAGTVALTRGEHTAALPAPTGLIPTDSVTIMATPRPETAGIRAGDVLEADPGVLAGGLKAYPMPDGRYQVVSSATDLPAAVTEALKDDGQAAVAGTLGQTMSIDERLTMFEQYATYTHATTGQWPVLVAKDGDTWSFWGHDDAGTQHSDPATHDEATAAAGIWVKSRSDGPFLVLEVGA